MNKPDSSKHFYSHLNNAVQILQLYDGSIPFAPFIKIYFSQNKKFGSRDRKAISNLCYTFFRLGKSSMELPTKERILYSLKYSVGAADEHWSKIIAEYPLPEAGPQNIFPWKNELSESVDPAAFEASFSLQPDLFLRIRPGFQQHIIRKLEKSGLKFSIDGNAVRLPNTAKINDVFYPDKEVVIQDLSSQKIASFFEHIKSKLATDSTISVYDCCAASGGKSILAKDTLQNIDLTVSDIRPSIISNLRKRFGDSGITGYKAFIADVSSRYFPESQQQYDLVIADVPCTGSGTWSRTPEQLYYFQEQKIADYATRQKSILQNISEAVRPGGFLLYITCSVFKKENEEQIKQVADQDYTLIKQEIITGYNNKADTMFAALLRRNKNV